MPTRLQENLAEEIIKDTKRKGKPRNKKELVVSSGYSVESANSSAHIIIEQKGVQEALAARGFSLERAKEVVGEILDDNKAQNKDRLKAADMVMKVHGAYAPEATVVQGNTYNIFMNPQVREATAEFERRMREVLALERPKET